MARVPKGLKYAAGVIGVLAVLMGVSIYWELACKIAFANDSAGEIVNIQIALEKDHEVPREIFWQGDLEIGRSKWIFRIPESSGVLNISFEIDGEKKDIDLGYIGVPHSYRINVRSKNDVAIVEIRRLSDFIR
jgi:hypothetical protein